MDEWNDDDICYECSGLGDDYIINDGGELECRCFDCIYWQRRNNER